MKTMELIKYLKISANSFYWLRQQGLIPAPVGGLGVRKHYSKSQVEEIAKIVKQLKDN